MGGVNAVKRELLCSELLFKFGPSAAVSLRMQKKVLASEFVEGKNTFAVFPNTPGSLAVAGFSR